MLIDNKKNGKVGDALKEHIQKNCSLSIVSAYFTIYAYEALKKELSKTKDVRFLFSSSFSDPQSHASRFISSENEERKFKNDLRHVKIAKECAQWFQEKVKAKETKTSGILPFNMVHVDNPSGSIAIQGSSNFSTTGLGYTYSNAFHMNTLVTDASTTKDFLSTFDEVWANDALVCEIKNEILSKLEDIYSDKSPEFAYFFTLYHIFKDFIGELDEEKIIRTKTGFKNTLVWNKLYNFQRDGVLGAIDKLEKHNGCIIADSVGLGKTFEALAIIKYYELRNDRVLVLCPKKLRDNWTLYTINDTRNILSADRFNYDVLNHTDLTREQGMSGEINLATINWANYDLIVIDESHNFRNTSTNKRTSKSRYAKLLEDVLQKGVKTKVLMLSATPVNNRLNDLKNQLAFITEGDDAAFQDSGINSVENTLRRAQSKFNIWLKLEDNERTTDKLMNLLNFDYFKLLDLVTIARSRKHIEKYYDVTEIGKFPERNKPINIKSDIDTQSDFPPLLEINKTIRKLTLCAYSPLKYVLPHKKEDYDKKYDIQVAGGSIFKQVDREQSLIHLMRVNLLKRMESSINSFALTIKKLLDRNENLIELLEKHSENFIDDMNIEDIDIDSEEYASELIGNKVKVLIGDIDQIKWKQDLENDIYKLRELLGIAHQIDASRDEKLQTLKQNIKNKLSNPINPGNKKVVIFTAFADTAQYLYNHIAPWAKDELGIHSAIVTGSGSNKTTLGTKSQDLSSILTNFSPISKERNKTSSKEEQEIDILIATDVISEGQNLQDCDYLINYDIHWNPVRIIQRFGRIDRLGSKNQSIQLVNFWPNMELDEYINLESRVSGRMVLLDVSATGEENIIDTSSKEMNDLGYRAKQLKELQENVIDLEDVSGGVSITDLTLNDFRMNLVEHLKENEEKLAQMPLGIHSIVKSDNAYLKETIGEGTIFCLKHLKSDKNQTDSYSLEPYYLVFVGTDNEIKLAFSNAKQILDIYKKLCLGQKHCIQEAIARFGQMTNNYEDMSHFTSGLDAAIESIVGKKEEIGLDSLFVRGGTSITAQHSSSKEEFELISYLVIQ